MSITSVHPIHVKENEYYSEPNMIQSFHQDKMCHIMETASQQLRQNTILTEYEEMSSYIMIVQSKLEILQTKLKTSVKAMCSKGDLPEPLLTCFEKNLENHQSELSSLAYNCPSPSTSTTSFDIDYFPLSDSGKSGHKVLQNDSTPDTSLQTESITLQNDSTFQTDYSLPDDKCNLPNYDDYCKSLSEKRNALDHFDYFDTLSVITNEEGFRNDLLNLIEKCNKPNMETPKKKGFIKTTSTMLFTGVWHWIRFTIVIFLAIIISLRQCKNQSHHK